MSTNEWYTPAKYVEAVRAVMGGIDLDPASCELANRTVQATTYYTKDQNGLMLPWFGRVWLNPPFGRLHPDQTGSTRTWQKEFALKLYREYLSGKVEQAILLAIGFQKVWFQPFFDFPVCIDASKIEYDRPDGTKETHRFSTSFTYLGPDEDRFAEIFSQFGRVVRAIDVSKSLPVACELWGEKVEA